MPVAAMTRDFRDAVCQKFGCAPEAYADTVFSQCLFAHAAWPAKLIRRLRPGYFDSDFQLIRRVASCTTLRQLQRDVDSQRHHHPPHTLLRRWLRIRLSGQRVIILGARVFKQPPTAASSHPQVLEG